MLGQQEPGWTLSKSKMVFQNLKTVELWFYKAGVVG
jgi:hypothetical protein